MQPIRELLAHWAAALGMPWAVEEDGFGQVFQTLLASAGRPDAEDRLHAMLVRPSDWQDSGPDQIVELITTAAGQPSPTVLGLCRGIGQSPAEWNSIVERARASTDQSPNVTLIVEDEVKAAYPTPRFDDPASDKIGAMPFTPAGYAAWATALARAVHRRTKPTHKAIIVDCDNTLWRGVCGEVGPTGIELTEGHLALHRLLVTQAESGVVIGLCSKNSAEDVERVWAERDDMVLPRDSVTIAAVNWRPKSENIREIGERLSLGTDSFIFVDDNPVECAEVEANCPGVTVTRFPDNDADMVRFCDHHWAFDLRNDAASGSRVEYYRAHLSREANRDTAPSLGEFLANLELRLTFHDIDSERIDRASELTLRTNQFHLSVRRRKVDELESDLASGDRGFLVGASDRFGEYGIVGLVIYRVNEDAVVAPTFLLSCRALGRGVEHRMLQRLGDIARDQGVGKVGLEYRETDRNEPALDFLRSIVPGAPIAKHGTLEMDASRAAEVTPDTNEPATRSPKTAASKPASGRTATSRHGGALDRSFELSVPAALLADRDSARNSPATPSTNGVQHLDDLETVIAAAFRDALGRPVDADIDFVEAGGHSLIAVGVFARILDHTGLELPISTLFEAGSIRSLARFVRARLTGASEREHRFVVPINEAGARKSDVANALFIAGGRNGNVVTLARLAREFDDRPVFGLQYRGVLGDDEPHETIEDAARDFLSEIRQVKPNGPYHLGGYSGGGLIAMAMAQQLIDAGETVSGLFLIDTRHPASRLQGWQSRMFRIRRLLHTGGISKAVLTKARRSLGWNEDASPSNPANREPAERLTPSQVRSIRIRDAFKVAANAFSPPSLDIPVLLFRPRDEQKVWLGPGTRATSINGSGVRVMDPDNGWGESFRTLRVEWVPGDHNTMLDHAALLAAAIREEAAGHEGSA